MSWTEERIELLRRLHAEGLSATQIAERLGEISRNAVIGKLNRLAKTPKGRPSAPARGMSAKPQPLPIISRTIKAWSPPKVCVPAPADHAEPPGVATIHSLEGHMCRWPIGDPVSEGFTYCGEAATAGPYCHRHAARAYHVKTIGRSAALTPA